MPPESCCAASAAAWVRSTLSSPSCPSTSATGARPPGEDHLDQIREQAKVIGHLCVVVVIMGVMIFFVHRYTDLDTARTEAEQQTERLAQVMPAAASSSETPYRANGALSILAGYSEENELVGYCVEVQAQGFGGVITMEVGVDLNGQVTGVAVTSHKETAGVGTRAMTPAALSRYVGRYGTLRTTGRERRRRRQWGHRHLQRHHRRRQPRPGHRGQSGCGGRQRGLCRRRSVTPAR